MGNKYKRSIRRDADALSFILGCYSVGINFLLLFFFIIM